MVSSAVKSPSRVPQRNRLARSDSNLSTASDASVRARQLLASGTADSLTLKRNDKKVPSSVSPTSARPPFKKFDLYSKQEESESTNDGDLPIVILSRSPPPSRIDCLSKNSRATNRGRQLVSAESWKGLDEMAQLHASFCSLRATNDHSDDDSGISLSSSDDESLLSDGASEEDILLFEDEDD